MKKLWGSLVVIAACGGGSTSLVRIEPEFPGGNCVDGGVAVSAGVDDNGDGVLQDGEIDSTSYVCDGSTPSVLVDTRPEEPGGNCAEGGTVVLIGNDVNGDGVLQEPEITRTIYLCNGADGSTVLVSTSPEDPGANCAAGGTAVHSGIDQDGDGVLDSSEIDNTVYVCNGAGGSIGPVLEGSYQIRNVVDEQLLAGVQVITGDLYVVAPGMHELVLPDLEEVDGEVRFDGSALTKIDLPALASVGGSIYANPMPDLAWVTMPSLTALGPVLDFAGGPVLPRCHLDDIATQLADNGWTGTETVGASVPCVTITACSIDDPLDTTATEGDDIVYTGSATTSDDTSPLVHAEVGLGDDGSDPAGWTWSDALLDTGALSADVFAPPVGDYDVGFRISGDGGRTFTLCDNVANLSVP